MRNAIPLFLLVASSTRGATGHASASGPMLHLASHPRVSFLPTCSPISISSRGDPWNVGKAAAIRGGAAKAQKESDRTLALKAGASAAVEALGLLGILAGAKKLAVKSIPILSRPLNGLPLVQWASFALVIFGSSFVKNLADGGMSAASNQALQVNHVPGDMKWYDSLKKPWFNPPAWVFPIMWVLVSKPTQLWAVSRLMRLPTTPFFPALTVYCGHLALGDVWNQVFFENQRIGLGKKVLSTMWGALVASSILFAGLDPTAGLLMVPTVGWVTVATALNWEIYGLNGDK